MVLSDKPKLIISKPNIIYKPKPKKVCKSNKNFSLCLLQNNKDHIIINQNLRKNLDLNLTNKSKSQNFDFNRISLEEMAKDFKRLKAKREIIRVEKELIQIFENSTRENSDEEKNKKKKIKGIKRPKNIKYVLYENNYDFNLDY